MRSENTGRWDLLHLLLRVFLGALFVYASWDKLLNPEAFAWMVYNYKILPPFMVNLAAVILPWTEMICGLLLIAGLLTRGSALTIDCLLFIFIVALGFNLYRGLDIGCGCFSVSPEAEKITFFTLMRDASLLVPGLWILMYQPKRWALDTLIKKHGK